MSQIWYNDLPNFITNNNYFIIIPLGQMSFEDKINSLMRFCIYLGVLLAIIRANTKYLMLPIVAGIVSVITYKFETNKKEIIETELEQKSLDVVDNKVCTRVTVDNPFMNPSIADLTFNPDKPGACDITNSKIRDKIDDKFNTRVFKDVNDIYNKQNSQRQFYTVASTTIPNDQGGFASWLYNRGPTCKEADGGIQCWRNVSDINIQTG